MGGGKSGQSQKYISLLTLMVPLHQLGDIQNLGAFWLFWHKLTSLFSHRRIWEWPTLVPKLEMSHHSGLLTNQVFVIWLGGHPRTSKNLRRKLGGRGTKEASDFSLWGWVTVPPRLSFLGMIHGAGPRQVPKTVHFWIRSWLGLLNLLQTSITWGKHC